MCQGPYGGEGAECPDPAVFEVTRHQFPALPLCPVHLGPALLLANAILWPPTIHLIAHP